MIRASDIHDSPPMLFDKNLVAFLTRRSVRDVEYDAAAGRLVWSHRVGKRLAVDAAGLRAYIATFALQQAPAPRAPRQRRAPDIDRPARQARLDALTEAAAARRPLFAERAR